MFFKCKTVLLISLNCAILFVLNLFSVDSFMVTNRVRAKLKIKYEKTQASLLKSALNVVTVGAPLHLSPLIEKGDHVRAQKEAEVPPLLPGIESFSGFITVNKTCESNMFFWMFKSFEGDWKTKPLIIWLQGGPGVSSMYGLFQEFGPFYVDKHHKLVKRKYPWCQKYNLMFIDNPVGSGFSFTKQDSGYANTELDVAEDLYTFIVQFYTMFPELRKNQLYIMGESYAGKYIPAFSHYIYLKNKENKGKGFIVPLAAVAIGNGFTDQLYMVSYGEYLYQLGFIDRGGRDLILKFEDEAKALIKAAKWVEADKLYNEKIFDAMYALAGLSNLYNYIKDVSLDGPEDEFLIKPETRKAIHVGNQNFGALSDIVYNHLSRDIMQSAKPWIEDILNWAAFDFVSYSGQLDIICAYPLSENVYYNLNWKHANEYKKAKRCEMGQPPVGYFKTTGVFTEIIFRGCGHMVPTDCPEAAFNFLDTFITNRTAGFKCV